MCHIAHGLHAYMCNIETSFRIGKCALLPFCILSHHTQMTTLFPFFFLPTCVYRSETNHGCTHYLKVLSLSSTPIYTYLCVLLYSSIHFLKLCYCFMIKAVSTDLVASIISPLSTYLSIYISIGSSSIFNWGGGVAQR